MRATPSGPYTQSAFQARATGCMPFRRNPRKASLRRKRRSNSSSSASQRPNGITEKGRTEMQKNTRIRVKQGSGNVFRDLGFPNPEREPLKSRLTLETYRLIKDRALWRVLYFDRRRIRPAHV